MFPKVILYKKYLLQIKDKIVNTRKSINQKLYKNYLYKRTNLASQDLFATS